MGMHVTARGAPPVMSGVGQRKNMQPYQGDGQFQWNKGAWFGGQIGATASLMLVGIGLFFVDIPLGLVCLFCGVVPNVWGYLMWRHRDRLAPYPAIQRLIVIDFAFSALAWGYAYYFGPSLETENLSVLEVARALLIFPAIMLLCHLQEQNGKRLRAQPRVSSNSHSTSTQGAGRRSLT